MMIESIGELLEHIKEVQIDVAGLSKESLLKISAYIQKNDLEVDEDISTALQYQDIITQQLDASVDAIDSMLKSIEIFAHAYNSDEGLAAETITKLKEKLAITLEEAKDKKSRFSGKSSPEHADDEIEFF